MIWRNVKYVRPKMKMLFEWKWNWGEKKAHQKNIKLNEIENEMA